MTRRPKLAIEMVPVADLIPYINNAKLHPEEQVSKIAASIKEFGFNDPIAVDGENGIIEGHGRLLAALKLKLGKVPVIRLDHLSETQKKAYILAHNKLTLDSGFDESILKLEMEGLRAEGFDLGLTGFEEEEIQALLDDLEGVDVSAHKRGNAQGDPDEVPEAPEMPFTQPGDLYTIGPHRLLCGDSTVLADVERLMEGERADMVFTDPPYGVNVSGAGGKSIHGDLSNTAISGFFPLAMDVLKDGGAIYLCGGNSNIPQYFKMFEIWCKQLPHLIIWVKEHFVIRRSDYHSRHEIICYGWKQGGKPESRWFGDRKQDDVWEFRRDSVNNAEHPTQKPVDLCSKAIQNSSPINGLTYEPFGGSGSTMVAAEQTGRKAYLIELSPHYCDVIVARMKRLFPELPVTRNGKAV